jgi:hypothetical protein
MMEGMMVKDWEDRNAREAAEEAQHLLPPRANRQTDPRPGQCRATAPARPRTTATCTCTGTCRNRGRRAIFVCLFHPLLRIQRVPWVATRDTSPTRAGTRGSASSTRWVTTRRFPDRTATRARTGTSTRLPNPKQHCAYLAGGSAASLRSGLAYYCPFSVQESTIRVRLRRDRNGAGARSRGTNEAHPPEGWHGTVAPPTHGARLHQ